MDWKTISNIVVILTYGVLLIAIFIGSAVVIWHEYVGRRKLRSRLERALEEKVELPAHKVQLIARGLGLNPAAANRIVFRMLGDHHGPNHDGLYELARQLEKVEPFAELPDEIKPVLVRLAEMADQSALSSDKLLIEPVRKSISDYVKLKNDVERRRRFTLLVNFIGIASFLVGLYATFTAPGIDEIKEAIAQTIALPEQTRK
ncbi:hypothetical protein EII20_10690 [Comamonadaceae bacterium OH2545_COT-014]|nr:hypothetical protein EII20_10690 [Comamonadaceae bacterium OH2545_COT-014]